MYYHAHMGRAHTLRGRSRHIRKPSPSLQRASNTMEALLSTLIWLKRCGGLRRVGNVIVCVCESEEGFVCVQLVNARLSLHSKTIPLVWLGQWVPYCERLIRGRSLQSEASDTGQLVRDYLCAPSANVLTNTRFPESG